MAFLSFLVVKKIFTNIYFHFLLVGHTHIDVNQIFSVLYQSITVQKCVELPEKMVEVWQNAYKDKQQQSNIIKLLAMYDWDTWFIQKINDITYHIVPKAFHFHRTFGENGVFKVKISAINGHWSEPYCILNYLLVDSFAILKLQCMSKEVYNYTIITLPGDIISETAKQIWHQILN